jgi:hypothetical protein
VALAQQCTNLRSTLLNGCNGTISHEARNMSSPASITLAT